MSKIYLKMRWCNHVLVVRKGGKKTISDRWHSEIVDGEDLLSQVLGRTRKKHGFKSPQATVVYNDFWRAVNNCLKNNTEEHFTVFDHTETPKRKMFTVYLSPVNIAFNFDGCAYIIKDDEGFVRVGGQLNNAHDGNAVVHSGLTEKQAEEQGIVRGKPDTAYMLERIEARAKEILEERSAKDAPFSVVPQSGVQKQKGKPKAKPKPKPKALWDNSAQSEDDTAQSDAKPRVDLTKSGKKLSKKQRNECQKFNVDPDNLPDVKPKGMNNRIWKAVSGATVL